MDIWRRVRVHYRAHKGLYHIARRGDVLNIAHEFISYTDSIVNGENTVSDVIIVNAKRKLSLRGR